jgi:hypothetical protein
MSDREIQATLNAPESQILSQLRLLQVPKIGDYVRHPSESRKILVVEHIEWEATKGTLDTVHIYGRLEEPSYR